MIPLAIIWDANPEIFELFGVSLRWYSLFFALAFLGGYYMVKFYTKRAKVSDKVYDYWLVFTVAGAIIGARLGHCLFYEFDYYSHHPLEILKVWKGGMASHGGAIGLLISLWIFSKRYKLNFTWILDKMAATFAIDAAYLRIGNLMNSEIFGYPTDLPWGFVFVNAKPAEVVPRHPTQLYEAICYFIVFLTIHFIDKRNNYKTPKGLLLSILLIGVFGTRFLIEFLKERQVNFENYMTLDMGQWLSIPFLITGILLFIYIKTKKNNNIKTEQYV